MKSTRTRLMELYVSMQADAALLKEHEEAVRQLENRLDRHKERERELLDEIIFNHKVDAYDY